LQNNGINSAQVQGSPLQSGGAGRFDASPSATPRFAPRIRAACWHPNVGPAAFRVNKPMPSSCNA